MTDSKRDELVAFKMTRSEYAKLERDAERLGLSKSELLRRGARAYPVNADRKARFDAKKPSSDV